MYARIFEGSHFFCGSSLSAGDDRARMAHAPSRRRGLSGNKGHNGFCDVLLRKLRGLFFRSAANLANHHDAIGFVVFLKQAQRVNVRSADDWISANTNSTRLAQA